MKVLIIDNDARHSDRLIKEFCSRLIDTTVCTTLASGLEGLERLRPSLVVSELILDTVSWYRTLHKIVVGASGARVAFITSYPSIASSTCATRVSAGYFAKPVCAQALIDWYDNATQRAQSRFDDVSDQIGDSLRRTRMSLDRAVWEIINQAVAENDSLSSAAEQLGIDRRSLRRMLSKYPPLR